MTNRFTDADLHAWHTDGGVLIKDFFSADEVAAVRADFEQVYGRSEGAAEPTLSESGFDATQFKSFQAVPLECSPALNLIGVHPQLIGLAKGLLQTQDVHLYQCQAWAKYTGDADYDQPFHCDFFHIRAVRPVNPGVCSAARLGHPRARCQCV